jgi:hypothetical protein
MEINGYWLRTDSRGVEPSATLSLVLRNFDLVSAGIPGYAEQVSKPAIGAAGTRQRGG